LEQEQRYKTEMTITDNSLNFVCLICGAQPQEKCELNSGQPRFASHRERRDTAKDRASIEPALVDLQHGMQNAPAKLKRRAPMANKSTEKH
jgi:hypothetical protein